MDAPSTPTALFQRIEASFLRQGLMQHLGARLLRAIGRVVRAGKRIVVTAAEVMHRDAGGKETVCALMQQTIVPVPKTY